jgi:hypothetical protein
MFNRILQLFIIILLLIFFLVPIFSVLNIERKPPEGFNFGVSYGLNTVSEAKLLIDKVKDYTNFFIINNWDVSTNETALTEICDYASAAGLTFIVFFDFIDLSAHGYPWHHQWVFTAKDRWGDKFAGIYIYEEPGGKQIDTGVFDEFHGGERKNLFENVTTYNEAAEVFVTELPKGISFNFLQNLNITKFVSDYALYWFDYLAGYDTIFTELGWNHSSPKHIGLCRGAAKAQNKDWGTIITWKSQQEDPTSIKTGPEMLDDMFISFEAGAKYVVVFNFPRFPEDNQFGVLTEEHFIAMEQFWDYASNHHEDYGKRNGKVAFVLPKDYGWGMRSQNDRIWGLWPSDEFSPIIWEKIDILLEKYDLELDIVYDDSRFNFAHYKEIVLWNTTIDNLGNLH